MAAARLAAVVLVFVASALTAQDTSRGSVVITVVDQSGAIISGAHVGIIQLPSVKQDDWLNYALHAAEETSAHTDADGKATVVLAKGSYAIAITQRGFKHYFERIEIRDESSQFLRATLVVGHLMCGVCVRPSPEIPLERTSLNILIPFEPLQTITLKLGRMPRR